MIGGWAYNRYAEIRSTGDIDFFVSDDKNNIAKIRVVLEKFGFASALPPIDRPLFEKKIIMLGRPPHRIDLLREISGITFNEASQNAESSLLDGIPLRFISKNDLIKNKLASGRPKDLLDVKNLTSP